MEPPTVGVKEGHDGDGQDLSIEGIRILEIVVPDLSNDVTKEFSNTLFGHLVTGIVVKAGFMGDLCTNTADSCGIIGNV